MVVATVLYTYRGKMLLGGVLTSLAVALQIFTNHYQITYYLILILLFVGFTQFYKDFKAKTLLLFLKDWSFIFSSFFSSWYFIY